MLKAYITNNYNDKVLDLYLCADGKLLNDICHILGIQSCINLGEKSKYEQMKHKLHWKLSRDLSVHSIELKNTLIDFYGTLGILRMHWMCLMVLRINIKPSLLYLV